MAKDDREDRYKEGVDFEWVKADNGNYRTRRFFTKKEKADRASGGSDKGSSTPARRSRSSAPETSPRPRRNPAVDAMKFGGPGDRRAAEERARRGRAGKGPSVDSAGPTKPVADAAPASPTRPSAEEGSPNRTAPKGMSQTGSLFGVPTYSPYAEQAKTRRQREREAREAAKAKGGRESPLGRMMDRLGFAKGGLVKRANCGASMKPTQKGKK